MNKGMQRYLDSLPEGSVRPADPAILAEYERSMREETIPAIERALKAQHRAAHFLRLGIPDPAIATAARQGGDAKEEDQTNDPA